jgi:hypothetical protein
MSRRRGPMEVEVPDRPLADVFLAATAVKDCTVGRVAEALVRSARGHDLVAGSLPAGDEKGANDVELFACRNGWVVLRWFQYCTCHVPVSQELSRQLRTVVFTADVCGDLWRHVAFERGRVVDRFASNRDHVRAWGGSGDSWAGDPRLLASLAGVESDAMARYLVEVTSHEWPGKAHPDNHFDLADPLVFIDLWCRMGIEYPDDKATAHAIVRFEADWEEKLPYEVADF